MSDEEVDVEEIMRNIREKVRKKKEIEINLHGTDKTNMKIHTEFDEQKNDSKVWEHLLESAYIENNSYAISSHRKVLGSFLVKGRKLVQGEMQRYVDPVIWKQQEFNKGSISVLSHICGSISKYNTELSDFTTILSSCSDRLTDHDNKLSSYRSIFENYDNKLSNLHDALLDYNNKLSNYYNILLDYNDKLSSYYNKLLDYDNKLYTYWNNLNEHNNKLNFCYKILSKQLEKNGSELRYLRVEELDIQYFDFENKFRGTEDEIKKRISIYLKYFSSGTILDIGCGRGEFLEILKDAGISGKGIEINEQMYHHCKNKNLDVELADAFVYLERQVDQSIDGIIMVQVIEHLSPDDIIEFLKLSYQKLKNGSYMILETVNIQNPGSLSNFYIDPTHKWPVHPDFLKYVAETKGFIECEILYRLYQENAHYIEQDLLKTTAPDYALICKKSGAK